MYLDYALFPMRVSNGKFFVAPLHWVTIVAHSVRCRSAAFINTLPHGKQSVSKMKEIIFHIPLHFHYGRFARSIFPPLEGMP